MLNIYHHPICPHSRQVRLYLNEIGAEHKLTKVEYWQRSTELLRLSPALNLPVLETAENEHIVGIYPVIEYFADSLENFFFMPKNTMARAKIRESLEWFNGKFYREVTKIILDEKMIRLMLRKGAPRVEFIKVGKKNFAKHIEVIESMLSMHTYLGSETISAADIAASCQLSVLDYFGEINWYSMPTVKEWYGLIKSRPGFKDILRDEIPGFMPPVHYRMIDF